MDTAPIRPDDQCRRGPGVDLGTQGLHRRPGRPSSAEARKRSHQRTRARPHGHPERRGIRRSRLQCGHRLTRHHLEIQHAGGPRPSAEP